MEKFDIPQGSDNLSDYEKEYVKIIDEMRETFLKKNRDYGSSFADTVRKFGYKPAVARLHDKYMRLENMALGRQMNIKESFEDTLLDLASYCILTLIEVRKEENIEQALRR